MDPRSVSDSVPRADGPDGPEKAPRAGAPPELTPADWDRLARLRRSFLDASGSTTGVALPDYWTSRRDLEIYDATFGARIGWKWNAVLDEIARRGLDVPSGTIVDWGAGTGVASRAFLRRFGAEGREVHLLDRSSDARRHAAERLRAEHPTCSVVEKPPERADVLLASHVLDELDTAGLDDLLVAASRARFFVWIESGAKSASRALSHARDRLLDTLDPLLPCTHRERCGVLVEGHESDWCHHFATPAPESFTTNHWRTFSRTLGIDLRSLPYSYLVARARDASPLPFAGACRRLGTGRTEKGRASFLVCDASGVRTCEILERTDKRFVKALREGEEERLLDVEERDGRVVHVAPREC